MSEMPANLNSFAKSGFDSMTFYERTSRSFSHIAGYSGFAALSLLMDK